MKSTFLLIFLFATAAPKAQEKIATTETVAMEGKLKKPFSFSLNELVSLPHKSIDSMVIYNHLMESKRTIRNIRGVLLKDILDKAGFDAAGHKALNEFFIICIATDNYKVVFSWNELYNTSTGEQVMIITEADGKKADQLPDRIALISPADRATGRRYVKGLQKILVRQVE